MTNILGISAFYHDSAACLIKDGEIIGAIQEERFTRIKHDESFPKNSIKYLLEESNLKLNELDEIIFYEKPFIKFERIIETYLSEAPFGFKFFFKSLPIWIKDKLFLKQNIVKQFKEIDITFNKPINFSEHHYSHAASAFYASPFKEAVILTVDGVGEWATTSVAIGNNNKIIIKDEINFPHSLGLLYSAFTYYLGFKVNSGEYKVMGLAPYGEPKYTETILNNLIDLKENGSFRLNMKYFNYSRGLTMTNKYFSKLFNKEKRKEESEKLEQFHMDVAASLQVVLEKVLLKITENLSNKYNIPNLCLAGGVALNCVANGKILEQNKFKKIWIQPASGDAGGALGSALALWYRDYVSERIVSDKDEMKGSYLGPSFKRNDILSMLNEVKANFKEIDMNDIPKITAEYIAEGKAVGWFQGKMEFGPRALGNRSILADPRDHKMQKNLNLKIKYRESFRPFAPAILREELEEWFNLGVDSPYMLLVADVLDKIKIKNKNQDQKLFGIDKLNEVRSLIPSVTHVDFSARVQTVDKNINPIFHSLISEFKKITDCPILINTSFNIRGEPIVCTPIDAYRCFMGTELDLLVIENFILLKENQLQKNKKSYKDKFTLD